MPTCGFVQILITLGKKAVLSMVDVILGGCLGLDGKWSTIHANTKATIPASENKINRTFLVRIILKDKLGTDTWNEKSGLLATKIENLFDRNPSFQ